MPNKHNVVNKAGQQDIDVFKQTIQTSCYHIHVHPVPDSVSKDLRHRQKQHLYITMHKTHVYIVVSSLITYRAYSVKLACVLTI